MATVAKGFSDDMSYPTDKKDISVRENVSIDDRYDVKGWSILSVTYGIVYLGSIVDNIYGQGVENSRVVVQENCGPTVVDRSVPVVDIYRGVRDEVCLDGDIKNDRKVVVENIKDFDLLYVGYKKVKDNYIKDNIDITKALNIGEEVRV